MEQTFVKPQRSCNRGAGSPASSNLQVPFGLRNGRMWTPRQVAAGKACGCQCPACGGHLVAKALASRRKRAHFAHLKGGNCRAGYETAIHLKAKQLIAEECRLWLPAWDGAEGMPNPPQLRDTAGFFLTGRRIEFQARETHLLEAITEQRQGDYVPDVCARDDQGDFLIEIRVTHAVDELKQRRIQSEGRRLVEIDLSRLKPEQVYDDVEFRRCVLDDVSLRKWLSYPSATDAWRLSLQELRAALAERERELAENKARQDAARRVQEAKQAQALADADRKQQRREAFRQELRRPYRAQLEQLPELVAPERINSLTAQYLDAVMPTIESLMAEVPPHMRRLLLVHPHHAWIYGVHPVFWQLMVYRHFVRERRAGDQFNQREVAKWVLHSFPKEQALYDLFIAQYRARHEARRAGFRKRNIASWVFTDEENAAIPDFYKPVNHLMARLVTARALRPVPGVRGELAVVPTYPPPSR